MRILKFLPERRAAIEATLADSHIFSGLPKEEIAAIAAICQTRPLEKGEVLFRQGETGQGLFIVQTGQIDINRIMPDLSKQIFHVFGARDSFAEAVIASCDVYQVNATALVPSLVIFIPREPFLKLIAHSPKLALHIIAAMSMHMRRMFQDVHDLKARQIESRLASWLLRQLDETAPHGPEAAATIILPTSKKTLAARLGVRSETLSRTFARYRDEGIIVVSKNRIHIADRAKLLAYADGDAPAPGVSNGK